jgi:AraC family transcriptional regulator of adaptative response / DNA-3-methyladenine glycosylase II
MEQRTTGFHAVVTTGIYCRDGCPASPLAHNVRDYAFPAAAEADGYRPCRRCRPEHAPAPTGGDDAPDLVCRALRMIAAGALDISSTDVLAHELGVSDRHLRRLFHHHVGASPDQVARSRRAHLAKRLLDESALPVSEVAFAAGFNSVRQMNRVVQSVFHRTPTELRRRSPARAVPGADGALVLRLPGRAPMAFDALFGFLRDRAIPGVESVSAASYRRTITTQGAPGMVQLEAVPNSPDLRMRVLLPSYRSLNHIVERARRLFDLDAPIESIDRQFAPDPILGPSVRTHPGMRVPGAWEPFEIAVRAVLGQQVTVAAATTLAGRLVESHGTTVTTPQGEVHRVWPSPDVLAGADPAAFGVPLARARTVLALSRAVADGDLVMDDRRPAAEVVAQLRALPGIGPWTASYIAMRALGDRDAFPSGDVALRAALERSGRRPSSAEVDAAFDAWRPWRAYAAVRLWHTRTVN